MAVPERGNDENNKESRPGRRLGLGSHFRGQPGQCKYKGHVFPHHPPPPGTRAHLEDLNKFRHPPALLPPTPIVSFPLNQLRESATWYPLTPLYRFACRPVRCLSSLRNRSAGSSDILNNSFRFRRLSRVGDNKMEILFCNSNRRRQALHGDNRLRVSDELEESV